MSARNVDKHNRFRCITVGFRVSPEEHEHINKAVAMSGLSKQEYCYRRCLGRDIVVQGNPRVYKALKDQLTDDSMLSIMMEQKKPENWNLTLPMEKIRKYFPRSYTPQKMEETILKLLDSWMRQQKRQRDQQR